MRKLLGSFGEASVWYVLALVLALIGDVLPYDGSILYGVAVGFVVLAVTRGHAAIERWSRERQMLGG